MTDSMRARGGGAIVNVTALTAAEPVAGFGLSASTWAAVIAAAKTMAIELGPDGIRVNMVCPAGQPGDGPLDGPSVSAECLVATVSRSPHEIIAASPTRSKRDTLLASPRRWDR
ncbi:SDR family oxidoreductase [Amycolatopsis rhizosphaerae]|uniref:SDR family oxidoreductase n=1 Tax=Amycolatopsis rhizosphaerae TaxID=2053003 RepID=A0A558D6R2_9PSEU|nr:SDR family oxidoreductase [Amycolatopsis rhizosphaerae]